MSEPTNKLPLVITDHVIREITAELHRKFQLHTNDITIEFDDFQIAIFIFPPTGQPFEIPDGSRTVRLRDDKTEILETSDITY